MPDVDGFLTPDEVAQIAKLKDHVLNASEAVLEQLLEELKDGVMVRSKGKKPSGNEGPKAVYDRFLNSLYDIFFETASTKTDTQIGNIHYAESFMWRQMMACGHEYDTEYRSALDRAVKFKNAPACYRAALDIENGAYGYKKDEAKALTLYKQAAGKGHTAAINVLIQRKLYLEASLEKQCQDKILAALEQFMDHAKLEYPPEKHPKLMAELQAFYAEAKPACNSSIYKYRANNPENGSQAGYNQFACSQLIELAKQKFHHRHEPSAILRILADVLLAVFGIATLTAAWGIKYKITGSATFWGENTRREDMLNEGLAAAIRP